MAAELYANHGVGYVAAADVLTTLASYGLSIATPLSEADQGRIVRASRMIDLMTFRSDTDDRTEYLRYAVGAEVPDRIAAATAVLALALPAAGADIPDLERQPSEISAGEITIKYPEGSPVLQPAQTDDDILAARLGIPSTLAFQLLRPFLVLPELEQDSSLRRADSGGGAVSFTTNERATSLAALNR